MITLLTLFVSQQVNSGNSYFLRFKFSKVSKKDLKYQYLKSIKGGLSFKPYYFMHLIFCQDINQVNYVSLMRSCDFLKMSSVSVFVYDIFSKFFEKLFCKSHQVKQSTNTRSIVSPSQS